MIQRDHQMNVSMLIGGVTSPLDWRACPVKRRSQYPVFVPEEPDWWTLPDGRLLALFRDNGGSKRFYRGGVFRWRRALVRSREDELSPMRRASFLPRRLTGFLCPCLERKPGRS